MADKTRKMKKIKSSKNGTSKQSKKEKRAAEREAKRAAKKGDGSFPDILVVTQGAAETANGLRDVFTGFNGEDMSGLTEDGQTIGVYKLRRVSTVAVKRKIVRG